MLRLLLLFNSHRPRARLALSVAGIALGVALGYAVHLVNRAAVEDVAAAVRSVAGEADIEVRGGRAGFAEALYPKIARLPGVRFVSPVLELDVGVAGTDRTLRVVGVDILRAAVLQPALLMEQRYDLIAPDRAFLSAGASAALGLAKGDTLQLVVGQRRLPLSVAGILPGSALRGQAALVDIATAQWRFGRLGELNRLDIRVARDADRAVMVERIQALLPPGAHAAPVENLEQASAYPSRAAASFAAGIAGAVIGALLPARDAARTPPARALKAGDEHAMFTRASSAVPGVILLAIGAVLAQLPAVQGLPLFGYAAIACLLIGTVALMPWLSRTVFDLLPALLPFARSPGLALALAQLRAAPGQAAVSLAAIVASFSLMAAMAIMVASFRQSVDDWLTRVLPAELYFRTTQAGDTGYLEPAFVEQARALPQIRRIDFLRSGRVILDPARPPLVLIARDRAAAAFPLVEQLAAVPPHPIWVSEAGEGIYGFGPCNSLSLSP